MTSAEGTMPEVDATASAAVAESLSTVGYAMFALLNSSPLEDIPSMSEFMERLRVEEAAATVSLSTDDAADVTESGAFGSTDVDDNFDAVQKQPPTTDDTPAGHPQPKNPVGSIPEYTGNQTLVMLQEISFLDE